MMVDCAACEIWLDQALHTNSLTMDSTQYTRMGQKITVANKTICKAGFWINQIVGSPVGTIYARIRKVSDDSIIETSPDTYDAATLAGVPRWFYFTFNSLVNEEVRILIEYNGTYGIRTSYKNADVCAGIFTVYKTGPYTDYAALDCSIKIYEVGDPYDCNTFDNQADCEECGCCWCCVGGVWQCVTCPCPAIDNQEDCEACGFNWCCVDGVWVCQEAECPTCFDYDNQEACEACGCCWYEGQCYPCDEVPCEYWETQLECESAGCCWCDGVCQECPCPVEPEPEPEPEPEVVKGIVHEFWREQRLTKLLGNLRFEGGTFLLRADAPVAYLEKDQLIYGKSAIAIPTEESLFIIECDMAYLNIEESLTIKMPIAIEGIEQLIMIEMSIGYTLKQREKRLKKLRRQKKVFGWGFATEESKKRKMAELEIAIEEEKEKTKGLSANIEKMEHEVEEIRKLKVEAEIKTHRKKLSKIQFRIAKKKLGILMRLVSKLGIGEVANIEETEKLIKSGDTTKLRAEAERLKHKILARIEKRLGED